MSSIALTLLQAAASLILMVQASPNASVALKQQAITVAEQAIQIATQQIQRNTTATAQSDTQTFKIPEPYAEQPAYLIAAYSKNGKNYIDVDYVEWLRDAEVSRQAQFEDGKCTTSRVEDCWAFTNGYKRNKNPEIRTFEVSSTALIVVNGNIGVRLGNSLNSNFSISFKKLEEEVSKLASFGDSEPPFKASKAFITIDVEDNVVTKIVEPFQQ